MKQKMTINPTYKQTFQLNLKMQKSLDFLKLGGADIHQIIQSLIQSNPFLELKENYQETDFNHLENIAQTHTLKDDLYAQLSTIKQDYNEMIIAYLIESLDQRGFLNLSAEQYMSDLQIDRSTFEKHLHILQSFEPIGVGAFDSYDSICIQLKYRHLDKSYKILRKSKELVLSKNNKIIASKYHMTKKEVNKIYEDIRSCNPFPCENYANESESIIIPDVDISVHNNNIIIQPYNDYSFSLNENLYEAVKDNPDMKEYFQEAHFFLDNLSKRNQTVMLVANALVNIQKGYFLYNDELTSCTLEDVAEKCHYHISTISRTINAKYYMFHNEVYPLKNLLVSKSSTGDSSDAIKKAMQLLIENEDKSHPLSDQEIADALVDFDLHCSRRVINKYRKIMHIPSSSQRKHK